jgi:molybdopterin-guanine dinucleotide biosynthesis protein A
MIWRVPALLRRRPTAPPGVVLAGGEGRRLGGGGKASVELLGRPLLLRALDVLAEAGLRHLAVVAKASTELPDLPDGVTTLIEPEEPRHPLAGLRHALRAAHGRPVVVLACDLPLVPAGLVARVAVSPPRGVLATVVRGQPLCGRYEPASLRLLDRVSTSPPAPRLTEVVAGLRPRLVDPLSDEDLHNVNTPEDLLTASALLDRRAAR